MNINKRKVLVQLYSFVLEFLIEPDDSWYFWKWKLDSFMLPDDTNVCPDLKIQLFHTSDTPAPAKDTMLLQDSVKIGFYTYELYLHSPDRLYWFIERPAKKQRILSFKINCERNAITLLEDNSETNGQLAFEVLIRILPIFFLNKSILQFHAVLLEDAGRGIAICADSGVGKTTHARLWRNHRRSIVIDGDRTSCIKDKNEWIAFGIPWCGTSGEYMNRSVPLKAIVILEQGDINETTRLTGLEAFIGVLAHLQFPRWNLVLTNKGLDLIQDLTDDIPVLRLRCRPDIESVEVLDKALREL